MRFSQLFQKSFTPPFVLLMLLLVIGGTVVDGAPKSHPLPTHGAVDQQEDNAVGVPPNNVPFPSDEKVSSSSSASTSGEGNAFPTTSDNKKSSAASSVATSNSTELAENKSDIDEAKELEEEQPEDDGQSTSASGFKNNDEVLVDEVVSGLRSVSLGNDDGALLRIMTFNTWITGAWVENGLDKIAKHIAKIDPDIVALQEIKDADTLAQIVGKLGGSWKTSHVASGHLDTAILTKHEFVEDIEPITLWRPYQMAPWFGLRVEPRPKNPNSIYGTGASVRLNNGQVVNFFSMHLDYRSYGPYAALNKRVTSADQIMAGEKSQKWRIGRAYNIEDLLNDEEFKKFAARVDSEPLIVAGDFNCPSHLDWTEETKDIHGGWVFEWPATKMMADAGFTDSFRKVHPNVTKTPGITWSTVQKASGWEWDYGIEEPQDRIDFILYKAPRGFEPLNSYTYAGDEPLAPESEESYVKNDYPSDHYAVVTEFSIGGKVAAEKLVN